MATQKNRSTVFPEGGFDVVCAIGHVRFGEGEQSPVEAAMTLIARHGAEGVYRFPHEDGGDWVVAVEFDQPHLSKNDDVRYDE